MKGYTVALLTVEDAQILQRIPERVRANYKAMDANDMAVTEDFSVGNRYPKPARVCYWNGWYDRADHFVRKYSIE
jgi:hypothetical protein